jgi:hypothetical protein
MTDKRTKDRSFEGELLAAQPPMTFYTAVTRDTKETGGNKNQIPSDYCGRVRIKSGE